MTFRIPRLLSTTDRAENFAFAFGRLPYSCRAKLSRPRRAKAVFEQNSETGPAMMLHSPGIFRFFSARFNTG
jgi:hypothetical protein